MTWRVTLWSRPICKCKHGNSPACARATNRLRLLTRPSDDLYYMSFGTVPDEIEGDTNFSFRVRTILKPLTSGSHRISLSIYRPSGAAHRRHARHQVGGQV